MGVPMGQLPRGEAFPVELPEGQLRPNVLASDQGSDGCAKRAGRAGSSGTRKRDASVQPRGEERIPRVPRRARLTAAASN